MLKKTTTLPLLVLALLFTVATVHARLVLPTLRLSWGAQPPADQAARHARQLVHRNDWATLSTNSIDFAGTPMGHTVSYSDGIGSSSTNATGELFFYLTSMDAAARNLAKDARASVSISMAQQGTNACKMDTMDPTCWKLTFIGRVVPVVGEDRIAFAKNALFSKHPQMASWPSNHGFSTYVMQIDTMLLLDFYGGAKHIQPKEYYQVQLTDA